MRTSTRLIAHTSIIPHRAYHRRVGRQALDFVGKPGLEIAIVSNNRLTDGTASPASPIDAP